ncbi:MAG: DegT/DnrJ/EryC1/StrS family aminotransferase [Gammaproteobacteria bacterium]|nr:DegT/DnrJ/EryC1/StrS family aminotransferase [Gammaproteobacteria bacterium]
MIPMVDLKTQYQQIKEEIDAAVLGVLESTRFILGPNVDAFEQEAANYLGVTHAISCASGTDALQLALVAAGIGPGDEVITSAFTFIATAEAIAYTGARPVFVDIDPQTFNIDPTEIEQAITPMTRAVLPVHLFGQPADMHRISKLCEHHGLALIEDCAQSFGAHIAGRQTGGFGPFGCFSFFPSKNLGCYGDGGMVTTDSDEHAAKLRILRNHGSRERYQHEMIGFNSRLDELQAAILRVKLRYITRYNGQRRTAAQTYTRLLKDTSVVTPIETEPSHHVYHQYTILSEQRDEIMETLGKAGIASAIYYPVPLHQQQAFAQHTEGLILPVTERLAEKCLSLPMHPELIRQDIEQIVSVLKTTL